MAFQPQEFSSPIDVVNRGLQHLGIPRIASFTEDTKQASEAAACYDKLRVAELRRNVWRSATRRALLRAVTPVYVAASGGIAAQLPTLAITPGTYQAGVMYFPGEIVADTNQVWWQGLTDNNVGNTPGMTADWERYFGPTSANPYDSTTAYSAGEHVYLQPNASTIDVYTSLIDANSAAPGTPRVWDSATAWMRGQVVKASTGYYFMSLVDLNVGNDPADTGATWEPGVTYAKSDTITGSDSFIYQSLADSNLGHDPTTSPTWWVRTGARALWTSSFRGGTGDPGWHRQQYMLTAGINWLAPMAADANSRGATRRVFLLPAGFLREAPADPKAGVISYLGAPANRLQEDYVFEGKYFTSSLSGPVLMRYVADISQVNTMDPMFCEGLAARVAMELAEPLTQSSEKWQRATRAYNTVMGEARLVNGIETGPVQPPLDDYLACRI